MLKIVDLPEATYHYHRQRSDSEDPDRELKNLIRALFEKHDGRYGYRRIRLALQALGHVINHKKVQRLMRELNLTCGKFIWKTRYRSYKGTVGGIAKNRLNRRFHTSYALQKIVTDVTEFKCTGEEKLYLSPMNLYNGDTIGMNVSKRPTLDFVLASLYQALPVFRAQASYAVNAAMENFFRLLKQEMYHREAFVSYKELKRKIERYVLYYNHERIKQKLAGMSPVQYRIHASPLAT